LSGLHQELLAWYDANRRALPWRAEPEPYAVWVSETMLQQTTVKAVLPYFERWMRRWPTLADFAAATEEEALSLWQGLGYYSRCRRLLQAARIAAERMPKSAEEWRALPGIGRYTAAAIASIAQGEAAPLVDGNVARVYARLEGDAAAPPALERNAWAWAASSMHQARPGDWNQALMELGAAVCRPRQPDCPACPWADRCRAKRDGHQGRLPKSRPKPDWIELEHAAVAAFHRGRIGLRRAPEGGWWQGLWEVPRCDAASPDELVERLLLEAAPSGAFRHTVTRHRIRVQVWRADLREPWPELTWAGWDELDAWPMPAPARRALNLAAGSLPRSESLG
jgi:A/G-specific adenine glycosylase